MKNLMQGIICLLLMFSCIRSAAQKPPVKEPDNNRPSMFQKSAQRMNCRIPDIESVLESPVGKQVTLQISDNMQFQGTVSSVASKFQNSLKSIVIRSNNSNGAALTFSKITRDDGSVYFTGRIISYQHADAYEIVFENGKYTFVKKGFYDLVNE